MAQITQKELDAIRKVADEVDGIVYRKYSGRDMYGNTCIGINCDDVASAIDAADRKEIKIKMAAWDEAGYGYMGYVVYWPHLEDDGSLRAAGYDE